MKRLPSDALVIVADGNGARVFRNRGENGQVSLHQADVLELMAMDDDGPAGAMPRDASLKQIDEATFAKQLALGLNDGAVKHEYEHLVLVADPTTLGRMRPLMHKEVQGRLLAEVDKTLTNAPLEDIERALRSLG